MPNIMSNRTRACEIIAQLMWGPKRLGELCEAVATDESVMRFWIADLTSAGLIYVDHWWRKSEGAYRWYPCYALQSEPFARSDAPTPQAVVNKNSKRMARRIDSRARARISEAA